MKKGFVFTQQQATKVGDKIGVNWNKVNKEQFRRGMDVESEHGKRDSQTNVTNDDPIKTGKIALAHLKEKDDYYTLLDKYVEHEGYARAFGSSEKELERAGEEAKRRKEVREYRERQKLNQMDILNIPKEERKEYVEYMEEGETPSEALGNLAEKESDPEKKRLLEKASKEEFKQEEIDEFAYMPEDKAIRIRKIQENIDRIKRGEKPDLADPEGAARWGGHEYYIFV